MIRIRLMISWWGGRDGSHEWTAEVRVERNLLDDDCIFFGINYTAKKLKGSHTKWTEQRNIYRIEGACTLGSNNTNARAGRRWRKVGGKERWREGGRGGGKCFLDFQKSIQTIWWLQVLVQTFVKFSSSNELNISVYPWMPRRVSKKVNCLYLLVLRIVYNYWILQCLISLVVGIEKERSLRRGGRTQSSLKNKPQPKQMLLGSNPCLTQCYSRNGRSSDGIVQLLNYI